MILVCGRTELPVRTGSGSEKPLLHHGSWTRSCHYQELVPSPVEKRQPATLRRNTAVTMDTWTVGRNLYLETHKSWAGGSLALSGPRSTAQHQGRWGVPSLPCWT